jgi:glycosyltransferase involved in cell wall biosynthesis
MARGDFVRFVDNDDWFEREALERMYATAQRDDADTRRTWKQRAAARAPALHRVAAGAKAILRPSRS